MKTLTLDGFFQKPFSDRTVHDVFNIELPDGWMLHDLHYLIDFMPPPTDADCKALVTRFPDSFSVIRNPSHNLCLFVVSRYGLDIVYVENPSHEICLAAVKNDPYALEFISNQTSEICMAAVQVNSLTIQFVTNQTLEVCLAAIDQDPTCYDLITNPTREIQERLIQHMPQCIARLDPQPFELVLLACCLNRDCLYLIRDPDLRNQVLLALC